MSAGNKQLLIERLKAILSSLDHLENPERNARIIELSLGLDGKGTHTLEQIQGKLDVEFPNEKISRERIRVLRTSGIKTFKKALSKQWDSFFDELYEFVYNQSPIEVELLAKRIADPSYESFELTTPQQKPFSESEFEVSGLLEVFESRPSKFKKKTLKMNRVYFDFSKTKVKQEGPTPRNSVDCLLFLVPNSFGVKLDVLLSHTERAIKFNGMLQEQSLLPLMPKKLPVHKREELAHSLLVGHKDFLWLDQNKGYFTFTSSLDNRISRFAAKVFQCTDEIHVSLFASQISRAVRSQARVLKGESASQHLKERSSFLQNASYGSDNPFTVNDAIRYFVGTKLCTIDSNNVLRPTQLFKDSVDVKLRWAENVLIEVLKNAPNQTLSQSDFKSQGMSMMSELASIGYLERLEKYLADKRISKVSDEYEFSAEFIASLQTNTRSSVDKYKSSLTSSRSVIHALYLDFVGKYKEKLKLCNANIATVREALREAKSTKSTSSKVLSALETQSSDLRLLKAECSDFVQRELKLTEELVRLERSMKKYAKVGLDSSKMFNEERQRKVIAERHLLVAERIFSDKDKVVEESILKQAAKTGTELMEHFSVIDNEEIQTFKSAENLVHLELLNISKITGLDNTTFDEGVEQQKFTDIMKFRFLAACLAHIDQYIDNLPEVNDKIDDLILDKLLAYPVNDTANVRVSVRSFNDNLLEAARNDETAHALGHFNQHVSYSPVLLRVRKAEYSFVGSEASKHAEIEYL